MYYQTITAYLCQFVQTRGTPLHRLASRSGIAEDVLLDVFASRSEPTPEVLYAITTALREDGDVARPGVPQPLVAQLRELARIDDELLGQIAAFARRGTNSADAGTGSRAGAGANARDAEWDAALDELTRAYAGYHGELARVLRAHGVKGGGGT